jgi:hypothetical protein
LKHTHKKMILTAVVAVLSLKAVLQTLQDTQFILMLWQFGHSSAVHTPKAAASVTEEIFTQLFGILVWWSIAVLAWLMRMGALERLPATEVAVRPSSSTAEVGVTQTGADWPPAPNHP